MKLDFWFDYHSPWSYLAATRLPEIAARHGAVCRWRPLHAARLIEAIGGRRPLEESPAFVRWYQQDMQDWAEAYGIKIRYHPAFPLRPARALRATLFAETEGKAEAFAMLVFKAYWRDNLDISDLRVLRETGEAVGLNGAAVVAAAADAKWKDQLTRNTKEAEEAGVFGVPMVNASGKLFFGNDRLQMLDAYLAMREIRG
jgi:2-hydroxychromene-2-carboxylate isomerase